MPAAPTTRRASTAPPAAPRPGAARARSASSGSATSPPPRSRLPPPRGRTRSASSTTARPFACRATSGRPRVGTGISEKATPERTRAPRDPETPRPVATSDAARSRDRRGVSILVKLIFSISSVESTNGVHAQCRQSLPHRSSPPKRSFSSPSPAPPIPTVCRRKAQSAVWRKCTIKSSPSTAPDRPART